MMHLTRPPKTGAPGTAQVHLDKLFVRPARYLCNAVNLQPAYGHNLDSLFYSETADLSVAPLRIFPNDLTSTHANR